MNGCPAEDDYMFSIQRCPVVERFRCWGSDLGETDYDVGYRDGLRGDARRSLLVASIEYVSGYRSGCVVAEPREPLGGGRRWASLRAGAPT